MPTPQGMRFTLLPVHHNVLIIRNRITAIATAVSNNQETIMSLAGEIAGIEERIKNLAAFYRFVLPHDSCSRTTRTFYRGQARIPRENEHGRRSVRTRSDRGWRACARV